MSLHHINLSYQAEADFADLGIDPSIQYMLATSPRSGSTMFALHLWQTGLLGAPMEYLNFRNSGDIVERLGRGDTVKYWHEVQRKRMSPNGIFGFKMFIGNYTVTQKHHPELVPYIKGDHVLYLTRSDKIAQAVSHYRASTTGMWFSGIQPTAKVDYSFEKILYWYYLAIRQDREWERVFTMTGTEPIRFIYEDVLHNIDSAMSRVLAALGVQDDPTASLKNIEITTPQAGVTSREWCERFKLELADRDQSIPL